MLDGEQVVATPGGDGGGAESGGEQAGGEQEEQVITEEPGGEGPGEGEETPGEGEGDEQQQQQRRGAVPDNAKLEAARKAHLGELKKSNPALAKFLESEMYKIKQLGLDQKGAMQQIVQMREAVELHGGLKGIEETAQTAQNALALEEGFARGDKKVVDGWATDFPDGFKKLVPYGLEKLKSLDEAYFNEVRTSVADGLLNDFQAYPAFARLDAALKADNLEAAKKEYADIAKFFGDVRGMAARSKANPYSDREKQLDAREQSIKESQTKTFYGGVRNEVNTAVQSAMNRELANLLKNRRLEANLANKVRKEIYSELQQAVNSRPEYQRQYKLVMAEANHEQSVKFITTNALRKLPEVVKQVLRDRNLLGPTIRPKAAASNGNRGPAGPKAPRVVTGSPAIDQVDFTKTDKATFIATRRTHGQAWTKDGVQHKW